VTIIHEPQGKNMCHFANQQEACKKDVENFLVVLQSYWATIQNP
jgi:hypothetical protein